MAFTLEPGESSEHVFPVGERLAMVQVLERRGPEEGQVEETLEAQRESLEQQKRTALIQTWIDRRRSDLEASGQLGVNLRPVN